MACGTGKTLVGYDVAQGIKARRVLALVPSLLLVQQMIREYRARGAKHILAVCSDDVASGEDAIQVSVKELDADATTDAKQARAFLAGKGQRIVVCTALPEDSRNDAKCRAARGIGGQRRERRRPQPG